MYKKEGVALTTPSLHPLLQDNANTILIASVAITISEQNIIKKSWCQVNDTAAVLISIGQKNQSNDFFAARKLVI